MLIFFESLNRMIEREKEIPKGFRCKEIKDVFQNTELSSNKRRKGSEESRRAEIGAIKKGTRKSQNGDANNANARASGIKSKFDFDINLIHVLHYRLF